MMQRQRGGAIEQIDVVFAAGVVNAGLPAHVIEPAPDVVVAIEKEPIVPCNAPDFPAWTFCAFCMRAARRSRRSARTPRAVSQLPATEVHPTTVHRSTESTRSGEEWAAIKIALAPVMRSELICKQKTRRKRETHL
jgi:hypothetical protein